MDEQAFAEFARAQHQGLTRVAVLLTGRAQAAEDLVQETLVRVFVHWGKVRRADSPGAYTRRMMTNLYLRQRERVGGSEPARGDAAAERGAVDGGFGRVDSRDQVRRALAGLPPRQRTAVVLRHYEQMTEAEAAAAMTCSVGTVKSLTSRGLASLRESMLPDAEERSRQ